MCLLSTVPVLIEQIRLSDQKTLFLALFVCNRLKELNVKKQSVGKTPKLSRLVLCRGFSKDRPSTPGC